MASKSIAGCHICFTNYDSVVQKPKILPCGHTFCSKCLLNISEQNNGLVTCPLCKRETVVTDLSLLTTNFSILDLISHDDQQEEAQPTSEASARAEQRLPLSAGICDDHGQHKLFKCKSCDKWICHACTVLEHPLDKCNIISVKKALEEMRNNINAEAEQFITEYNQTFNHLGVYSKELQTLEKELEHVLEQCKEAKKGVAGEHLKLKKAQEEGLANLQDLKEFQSRVSKLSGVQEIEDCSQAVSHYKESVQTWTQDLPNMTIGKSLLLEPQRLTESLLQLSRQDRNETKMKIPENASKISVMESSIGIEVELERMLRCILNQVTPENLKEVVTTIKQKRINTLERHLILVELLYKNAVEKPGSSDIYAQILSQVSSHAESREVKKLMINKCQKEFEKDRNTFKATRKREIDEVTNPIRKLELSLQLDNDLKKCSELSKNNIKLIGELYKLHMMTTTIIHRIIQSLLEKRDELSLECLCILLTVTGKLCETQCKLRPEAMQEWDKYFIEMNKIMSDHQISNQLRNLMIDVINLRQNNWVPQEEPTMETSTAT